MNKYNLGVIRVSETKWKGNGAKEVEDCYVVNSGVSDGRTKAGGVMFFSKEMSRCVKSWQCVSERIIVVRLRMEKLKDSEVRLRFQWRLWLKMKESVDADNREVEKAWKEFEESVMNMAVEVCGARQCGDRQKWTGWWNEKVKAAVRKKIAYQRWLQLRTPGAREKYVEAKTKPKRVVRKA